MKAAEGAPVGAYCAVSALDFADSWNAFAGDPVYENAEEEVRDIRSFQREHAEEGAVLSHTVRPALPSLSGIGRAEAVNRWCEAGLEGP